MKTILKTLVALVLMTSCVFASTSAPASARRLAIYLKFHNRSDYAAWVTLYKCNFLSCGISSAHEVGPKSAKDLSVLLDGEDLKVRAQVPSHGTKWDRSTNEQSFDHQHVNVCLHSDITITWC